MGCCDEARKADQYQFPSVTPETDPVLPEQPTMELRYLGRAAIILCGPRSGQSYIFQPGEAAWRVDWRDAEVLLRTGLFRRSAAKRQ